MRDVDKARMQDEAKREVTRPGHTSHPGLAGALARYLQTEAVVEHAASERDDRLAEEKRPKRSGRADEG